MNHIICAGAHPQEPDSHWHHHDHWELIYCTSGKGCFELESGAAIPYQEGDMVFIPPKENHANFSKDGLSHIYAQISDPTFPYRAAFRISDDTGRHMKAVLHRAERCCQKDLSRSELVLCALGNLIIGYSVVYRSNAGISEPVDYIRNLILDNYTDPDFSLNDALSQLPFNYDYLRKLFKKRMGITPLEYMTRIRMHKAERILSAPDSRDFSMTKVAGLCGYSDALYFSRVFKKSYGMSPRAYANHHRHI